MSPTERTILLDAIARALEYPRAETSSLCVAGASLVPGDHGAMTQALEKLAGWLNVTPRGKAEEWYSQIFDLSPVCTLNIGYHLFGEQYERGAFLAGLVAEHRDAGLELPADLPDFLPTVLRLVGRVQSEADAQVLCSHALLPALDRMGDALTESDAPWAAVLAALPALIEHLFEVRSIPKEDYPSQDQKFMGKRLAVTESGLNRRRGPGQGGGAHA